MKQVLIKKDPRSTNKTHTPDCKWAAGHENWCIAQGFGSQYDQVPASSVPKDQPRCSWCGGGR